MASRSAACELDWVGAADKPGLIELAEALQRQTMNMRLPTARMIWARHAGRVVGWVGIDIDRDPQRPELFSLYLDPAYRAQQLSRILRLAATSFLLRRGITEAFGRIAVSEGLDALSYWIASGACRTATSAEAPPEFASMCRQCNLYGNACSERVFVVLDVQRVHDDDVARVALTTPAVLPMRVAMLPSPKLAMVS
jgi:GNAT superfamily N-acetyltransferase